MNVRSRSNLPYTMGKILFLAEMMLWSCNLPEWNVLLGTPESMALPLLWAKFPESTLGASWQRNEASNGDSVLWPFISFPWNSILKNYSSLENMTPDMWKIMTHLKGPPVLPRIPAFGYQLIPFRKVGLQNKRNRLSEGIFTSSDWSICSFTALMTKLPLRCVCVRAP